MLTKQDLEDIWENKPYGYFSKLVKDLKAKSKLTKFTVTARLIQITEKEVTSVSEIVYCKSSKDYQIRDCEAKLRSTLYKNPNFVTGSVFKYDIKPLT